MRTSLQTRWGTLSCSKKAKRDKHFTDKDKKAFSQNSDELERKDIIEAKFSFFPLVPPAQYLSSQYGNIIDKIKSFTQ